MFEVEMKLAVEAEEFVAVIEKEGAKLVSREEQCDQYFQHPSRDFSCTDEALRIRKCGNHLELTYKGPKRGDWGKVRQESSCGISGNDEMKVILDALGFQGAGTVRKTREKWRLQDMEIALDQVEGLGDFMEAELVVDEKQSAGALQRVSDRIRSLGLDPAQEIRKSYLELLQERNP